MAIPSPMAMKYTHETNPLHVDTDADGLSDDEELATYETDPNSTDSDEDGLTDIEEIYRGLNPNSPDSDTDGLSR